MKQVIKLICFVLLVVVLLAFSACAGNQSENEMTTEANAQYEQLIPIEQLDKLTLKIYFRSTTLIGSPMDQKDLISFAAQTDSVITVAPAELIKHTELLESLTSSTLITPEESFEMNARLCYFFENENGERVFELVTNGYGAATAWVNGEMVANRKIFYEIICPFLTEEAIKITEIPQSFYSKE